MPKGTKSKYENVTFVGAKGTRAFYRRAAALVGVSWTKWMRQVLHREALRVLTEHGEELEPPPVHPVRPPPLQPRSR
jgi:hypothetical protein